jgi:nitrate reductase beta subunit
VTPKEAALEPHVVALDCVHQAVLEAVTEEGIPGVIICSSTSSPIFRKFISDATISVQTADHNRLPMWYTEFFVTPLRSLVHICKYMSLLFTVEILQFLFLTTS